MEKIILTVLFLCTLNASLACTPISQVVFLLYARGCVIFVTYPQNCICIGNIYFSIGRRETRIVKYNAIPKDVPILS